MYACSELPQVEASPSGIAIAINAVERGRERFRYARGHNRASH